MRFARVLISLVFLLSSVALLANLRLPRLVSDGMVLQREEPVKIWGWDTPKTTVAVSFNGQRQQATVGTDGSWMVELPAQSAGGPYQLQIDGSDQQITLENVLFGDVWVCSGQSNMELPMRRVSPLYAEEIKTANFQNIRYFTVPQKYDFDAPHVDLDGGQWQPLDQEIVQDVSAVAFFFATKIHAEYGVPIGIIDASLGGSPIEAWLSEKNIKAFPAAYQEYCWYKNNQTGIDSIIAADRARAGIWHNSLNSNDKGYQTNPSWHQGIRSANLEQMEVPGFWPQDDLGDQNGVFWFQKEFELSKSMAAQDLDLELGRLVDADSTFINGVYVGNITYKYPPRRYRVPKDVLVAGTNKIVIRIVSNIGRGGFLQGKSYELRGKKDTVSLVGEWTYAMGARMPPLEPQTFIRWKPVGLYNTMIAPLQNYPIKGVLWYQGESNVSRASTYSTMLQTLVKSWREQWQIGAFPVIWVQLANYLEKTDQPVDSDWALLREAQSEALVAVNTGMVVTTDLGEWNDIHPLNKKDVGYRLAKAAGHLAYQDEAVYAGPSYTHMRVYDQQIEVFFKDIGSGLVARNTPVLRHFAIAGEDQVFHWANAEIEGNKIVVWSKGVPQPVAVRYGWSNNPEDANLYNKEGLPAVPFRTDNW